MTLQPALPEHTFQALGDPTRRAIVERLSQGPASVSELAAPFEMALPSFLQHLKVLEGRGLIRTVKNGRVRRCEIIPEPFDAATRWLEDQRTLWSARLDRLDAYLTTLKDGDAS
ncbi:MAG: metalloregulator ArsR/SmtB family transcription factor [Beijerinckiaceae bacterium]|nr:metalloregulator ArsR/SmtB family transcription factor [Beijerinckiaceae bacterium]